MKKKDNYENSNTTWLIESSDYTVKKRWVRESPNILWYSVSKEFYLWYLLCFVNATVIIALTAMKGYSTLGFLTYILKYPVLKKTLLSVSFKHHYINCK